MPLPARIRRWNTLASIAGALLLTNPIHSLGQSAGADEQEVRALMLYNLTKFIDWPTDKNVDLRSPFVFCVAANDNLVGDLDALTHGKEVAGHPVVVHQVQSTKRLDGCSVFYASDSLLRRAGDVPGPSNRVGLLTVSDGHIAHDGTVVGLPSVQNRIKIEIDLTAAQHSGLTISSHLLEIATVTR